MMIHYKILSTVDIYYYFEQQLFNYFIINFIAIGSRIHNVLTPTMKSIN